jgi:hypothetical protein
MSKLILAALLWVVTLISMTGTMRAQEFAVTTARVHLLEKNPTVIYQQPMILHVRVSEAIGLHNVQVRVFPKKHLDTITKAPLERTPAGCDIFASHVDTYQPSVEDPHISLMSIHDSDLKCVNGFLASTDFVMVVESDNNTDDRFLRVDRSQASRYFRYAQAFRVAPAPGQACRSYQPRDGYRSAERGPASTASHEISAVEGDAPVECIKKVD